MSLTTDFIAELIRAANEADRLSQFEVKRLLNRSIATVRDMREQTKHSPDLRLFYRTCEETLTLMQRSHHVW
ncbi:hypothetical protein SFHH103_00158 [Sinorhizobium fredii HH103]|uniref:DNA-binding protein n=1 Tax=Sinorhizobium fredii (strain HH103) TaxID=1117943 RepID=G9AA71_SINF1|nr:hypothetical protein EPK84_28475 [Sinorhizobium fredii]CCE94662.1 hypothetical protein SFHH103_00158 [Sinorhizobium fredii HH103]